MSVLCSFDLSMKIEDCDLPLLYWIPKLHKCPYKQHYIAGAAKPLYKIITSILTAVKTGLQTYNDICFSRGGVNQMWILKISKNLLETLGSRSLYVGNCSKTFDFSTLYTTISHRLLKSRIKELIQRCFSKKNGEQRYQYLAIGRDKTSRAFKNEDRKLFQTFNSSFRYIDDVQSLNNSRFGYYLHLIYAMSLELRILWILKTLLLILAFTLKLTKEED